MKVYMTAIILPIGKPGIITVGILTFFNIWNELFISLVLLHATEHRDDHPDPGAARAGSTRQILPVLIAGPGAGHAAALFRQRPGLHSRHVVRGRALMSGCPPSDEDRSKDSEQ